MRNSLFTVLALAALFVPHEVSAATPSPERDEAAALRDAARVVTLPVGFKYEVLVQGDIPEPLDLKFCPDGRLWFTGRRGHLWAYDFRAKSKTLITQLPVDWQPIPGRESNERGLHGLEFDPDFLRNGFLYLFYSPGYAGTHSNRVARFTVRRDANGAGATLTDETVLLEFASTKGFHQGGALKINPRERTLYVSAGDNNVSTDTKKFFDDPLNQPQNLADLRGKILRLNLDGSVPRDNPFVNTPGARPEIYTYGHRNPYSMNFDEPSGRMYVGEVGYDRKEDFEEINLLKPGANYGWPRCIGPNLGTFGGDCPIQDAQLPWLYYGHENGANVTSGPFYRRSTGAFGFPAAYHNGMFYADFTRKWIRFAQVDPANNAVKTTVPFARGFAGGPLAMQQGSDGGIYFTEYAGWFTGTPKDRISRIIYAP